MLCWTVLAVLNSPIAADPFLRYPDIHGDKVVFTSEGDLWVGDLASGHASRLTSDPGVERNAAFSPDGQSIAFEGEYDGQRQAYVMPTSGGAPRRLSSVEGFRAVTGWTPDGKNVVFRSLGVPTHYAHSLVPATGGVPTKLPLEFASHVAFGSDPGAYVFTRFNRWSHAWFRYVGGMQNQIWIHRPAKRPGEKPFRQISQQEGTNEFPVWRGDRIYFVNEQKAKFTLMSVPEDGGKAKAELPPADLEIRELSSDGRRVVYQQGRDVYVFDPSNPKLGPKRVELRFESDLLHTRPNLVTAESHVQGSSITPTGKRVLVEARGQILTVPVGEGEARVWKARPGVRFRHPSMSPDAKKVAFVSDDGGQQQVWAANSDGTGDRQLTKDSDGQIWGTRFSPDGKWIAFTDSKTALRLVHAETGEQKTVANIPFTWFAAPFDFSPDSKWVAYANVIPGSLLYSIELYEIATGKTTRVSDGRSNDRFPSFTPDGKYLAFASSRNVSVSADPVQNQLNAAPMDIVCLVALRTDVDDPFVAKDPEEAAAKVEEKKVEFRIDLDGLYGRRIELPTAPATVSGLGTTTGRILYLADGNLKFYDLAAKTAGDLGPATTFQVASDNTSVLVPVGPVLTVMNEKGEGKKTATFGGIRLRVEPVAEWSQVFWDAWRHLRDYFYVPNMHGLDWKAIGAKYAAMLPSVRSRDEVDELIRWMQAEIGSSHQYLTPGDQQDIKPRVAGAYLGVDLVADPSGFFRISKIYRGDGFRAAERSPLLGVGKAIREGMFLVEVAGEPVRVGEDPYAGLAGRAGRTVSIKVSDTPSPNGAKTYFVKPVASEMRMRYLDWVESNRTYVEKASGGKLGYIHMSAMSVGNMNDFIRQYFPQRDREGLVMDVRFNTGGFVQDFVNRILTSSLTGFFNMRDSSLSWTRQQDYFLGPIAVIMNEFNISCGEEFPHRFRDLKRGPIFGRRTMGGEVGSDPGWPLIDGGQVSVPNYGMWTPKDGWVIEGAGVEPDYDVPSDPNAFLEGKDPQLDRTIAWLLEDLKKRPPVKLSHPGVRDRVNGGE